MRFDVKGSNFPREVERAKREFKRDVRKAARRAADKASKDAQRHIRARMQSVGLGKLGNAVGQSSALKKRDEKGMWGVIFAKGNRGADNRGAGALEAYTEGVTIRARNGTWLAYPTNAIPRLTSVSGRRQRMTPRTYQASGFAQRLGPLEFRPVSRTLALLVVKKVTLSPKTGRAARDRGQNTRTRIRAKEVVVFVLIRFTHRAKRLDHRSIVAIYGRRLPKYIEEELAQIRPGSAPGPRPPSR